MCASTDNVVRRHFDLRGQVQGVGFRPYVYRLAREACLAGFVANNGQGAVIEVEGPPLAVDAFQKNLSDRLPPLAQITTLTSRSIPPVGDTEFCITPSRPDADRRPEVTPDAATCDDCRRELFDPADRRRGYAFINCTNCGPRYSIIKTVPYDRPYTTMAKFIMCKPCAAEYADPADRRFHAQPNACALCGPELRFCRPDRSVIDGDPIREAAAMLAQGHIVAVKGIGGYHLACRADIESAVAELRRRKIRDGKPLAVMVPDIDTARRLSVIDDGAIEALTSPAAPIVLAPKRAEGELAASVAPGCGCFGLMLPYAPVHHLLFAEGVGPLVMTSANLAGEPLTFEDDDAFDGLGSVADAFLTHNRDIHRPIDDSVVFEFRGQVIPMRRARGYAPRPIRVELPGCAAGVLAVGGELKSTVCLLKSGEAILSEHLGDLVQAGTYRNFVRAVERLQELFAFSPRLVAHDLHPQYLSTRYARGLGLPTFGVQHHYAHIASVMAESGEAGPVIGLACDGTGYGLDGAVWGCELLRCDWDGFDRLGHLEYFRLVGGDRAAIETWRPAAALLRQALGPAWLDEAGPLFADIEAEALTLFDRQADGGVNAPFASSLGRVFDAVSFLAGLCRRNRHEAEGAMALESAAGDTAAAPYSFAVTARNGRVAISLAPAIAEIVEAARTGKPANVLAARFHETVAAMLAKSAALGCELAGVQTVALSGGCFCNCRLLGRLVGLLEDRRLRVLYHRRVPSGDGGISLGQAAVAARRLAGPGMNQGTGANG